MTRHIRALLVTLLLFGAQAVHADTDDALSMLRNNDIARLEESLSAVQRRFESGELTEYELRNAFRPFYKVDAIAEKHLQNWVANSPRSYAAHLALGIVYKRHGGDARGSDSIANTPQQNINEMGRYFRLSDAELRTSLDLTKKPYLSIFHLLEITGNTGPRSASEALLLRANEVLPSNALVRARFTNFLLPRWGGSYDQVERFIADCIRQNAPADVILQLKAIEHNDMGHTLLDQGENAAANEHFEEALRLGQKVGGTFSTEFLTLSRHYACRTPNTSSYCQ